MRQLQPLGPRFRQNSRDGTAHRSEAKQGYTQWFADARGMGRIILLHCASDLPLSHRTLLKTRQDLQCFDDT
jgi:hypothetical protein